MSNSWEDRYINKVVQGDCLELMKELPDNSVDITLTDPPYGIGFDKYDVHDDVVDGYEIMMNSVISEMNRVTSSWCVLYQSGKSWMKYHKIIPDHAYPIYLLKTFAQYRHGIVPSTDIVFVWKSGDDAKYLDNGGIRRNWFLCHDSSITNSKLGHPCSRPISGVKYLLSMLQGNIVLDPFVGSGTTLVAARELGRDFIGIDISEDYVLVARKRVAETREEREIAGLPLNFEDMCE